MPKHKVPKKSGSVALVQAVVSSSSLVPYTVYVARVLWSYINLQSILINYLFFLQEVPLWTGKGRGHVWEQSCNKRKAQNATRGSKSLLKYASHLMQ